MKGSEKQIKWATDIKINIIAIIDALIADGERCAINPKYAQMKPQIEEKLSGLRAQKAAIESCEYSWELIDCFEGISANAPMEKRIGAFIARCRVHPPQNETQKKLLGC